MKRSKWQSHIYLVLAICLALNFSEKAGGAVRSFAIGSIAPSWKVFSHLKEKSFFLLGAKVPAVSDEALAKMEELKRENELLSLQVDHLRQWLVSEDRVEEQIARLKAIDKEDKTDLSFFKRRKDQIAKILKLQLKSLPAKVVYREPCSWSSFIWVNVGERDNNSLKEDIVAKNSPVVIGNVLIGVVEEVYYAKSKVRLITDHRLVPAVRSVRGASQNQILLGQIESLSQTLQSRSDLFSSEKKEKESLLYLQYLQDLATGPCIDSYLAKGELYGSSLPLWRSRGQKLKGVGFNYDFSDEEGPARDLRTGEDLSHQKKEPLAILKEGDLLVTSGFDGIFPMGLEVATVTKVECLREGGFSYEIEAKALVKDFNDLSMVLVLPPL